MKIGIMTFWWSEDNYGQLLQCYALQKYLRDAGHDAYLIRYDPRGDYIKLSLGKRLLKVFNPVLLFNYLLSKKRMFVDMREKSDNPRCFEEFRNKNIKQSDRIYYSYKELVENPPSADVYIVGSDQVWNTFNASVNRAINVVNAYLLNFGDSSIKRIAYAASFGKEKKEIDSDFIKLFTVLLKNFDYISVRENSGLDICRQCGVNNMELASDPTMLLDVHKYRALYNDEPVRKPDKPYCFLYLLGNTFNFPIKSIYNWVKNKDIDIFYVTGNSQQDNFKKTYATIPEWMYLIEHAEYIITNSFHCTIFSLLFKKKFGIIPLDGINIGMNSRFDTLMQLFNIESRYITLNFTNLEKEINWQSVSDIFIRIRNTCKLQDFAESSI